MTVVTLKISRGNQKVLPDVTNLSESQAISKLRNSGFTNVVTVSRTTDNPSEVGVVVSQDPESGGTGLDHHEDHNLHRQGRGHNAAVAESLEERDAL